MFTLKEEEERRKTAKQFTDSFIVIFFIEL